jgi:hypothetical protein
MVFLPIILALYLNDGLLIHWLRSSDQNIVAAKRVLISLRILAMDTLEKVNLWHKEDKPNFTFCQEGPL